MPKYVTYLDGMTSSCEICIFNWFGFFLTRDLRLGGIKELACVLWDLMVSHHLLHHAVKLLMVSLSARLICFIEWLRARKAVSSAYLKRWTFCTKGGKSARKRRYRSGNSEKSLGFFTTVENRVGDNRVIVDVA